MHLIKSPLVARKGLDRNWLLPVFAFSLLIIGIVSVKIGLIGSNIISEVERRGGPAPAGILPLRFRGKMQPQTGYGRIDLFDKDLAITPTDAVHWQIIPFEIAGVVSPYRLL